MLQVCICGGGSLGHVCAGVLSSQNEVAVNIYTKQPSRWSRELTVTDNNGKEYKGKLNIVSSNPEDCISNCDIILLCLPGYAIEGVLKEIQPFLNKRCCVGTIVSSTGFFFKAHEILPSPTALFGFQRVPYIARVKDYGKTASLLGYKSEVAVAMENIDDTEQMRTIIENLFITPTVLLNNFYEASLTNSNPILHTGRLYSMFKEWKGEIYDHNILFYKEWTDDASQILIEMDSEFMSLLDHLPVDKSKIPSLLKYYEVHDAASLTRKIASIQAFQTILSPMSEVDGGWIPDFSSRYFTEDFPHGLRYIKQLADEHNVPVPTIDKVYAWGMQKCNK